MGGGESAPPPQSNPARDLKKYVGALDKIMPQLLGLEGSARPQFGALNLADQSQYLSGILGLGGTAQDAAAQQLQKQRQTDYANMQSNIGSVSGILGGIDPTGKAAVDRAGAMADTAYQKSIGPLSFEQRRGADQQAREAFGSRGRINDNVSVAGEILGREEVRAANRAEASALNQNAFGLSQQFTSPAMALLTGVPASSALGQDYLNSSAGAIGKNTPQMIDTGAGLQMGAQNASNLASWQQANASAKNAQSAQNTQLAASALAAIASIYSDERLKTDKKRVGKTDDGLPIYTYKMKGSPKSMMGVMAQDVKKKQPDALGPTMAGLLTVNYSKVS